MAKRKRELESSKATTVKREDSPIKVNKTNGHVDVKTAGPVISIVAGSYERVLHGISASVSGLGSSKPSVEFADSFLFNAHASAVRCVAISPLPDAGQVDSNGVYLATGGSDERVNIYSLAASPMLEGDRVPIMPSLGENKIIENPGNRELGSLMQHSSNITALHFPTRSKLLSAAEDNTISISRTRDLTTVSTIKAPRPKVQGQPSGDTAPPGATPAGVNDFAIHPSMKLMISVGRGERCMRLWNLVTGKKAGVLNFDRSLLTAVKEGKYSSGEGRKIRWNPAGTEFAVAFERGVVVFGDDSQPRCTILPQPLTKVHQISYLSIPSNGHHLAVSTEDGRIVLYDTSKTTSTDTTAVPVAGSVGQIGGKTVSGSGRLKDFKILYPVIASENQQKILVVTANSDGCVRLWNLQPSDISEEDLQGSSRQIGDLVGSYQTGNRITCLDAFVMLPARDGDTGLSEFDGFTETEDEDVSSTDSSDEE